MFKIFLLLVTALSSVSCLVNREEMLSDGHYYSGYFDIVSENNGNKLRVIMNDRNNIVVKINEIVAEKEMILLGTIYDGSQPQYDYYEALLKTNSIDVGEIYIENYHYKKGTINIQYTP